VAERRLAAKLHAMAGNLGSIHDVAERLAATAPAIANLCVLPARAQVAEHTHANPYLWLHALGAHAEASEAGEVTVGGPAAMFFPAGSAHGMAVRGQGLASVIVEFDEDWLRRGLGARVDLGRPRQWIGGAVGRRAGELARGWLAGGVDQERFARTERFLAWALVVAPERPAPAWLDALDGLIDADEPAPCTAALARRFDVSSPWLARAYRHWRGEGLGEAMRRRRVEAAALMLETEAIGLAEIAVAAGFCDQSHMTRAFRRQLGRTPGAVRAAKLGLSGGGS
jgi:AraC family transcriptional regulator